MQCAPLLAGGALAAERAPANSVAPALIAFVESMAHREHPRASRIHVTAPRLGTRTLVPACASGHAFALRGQRAVGNVSVLVTCADLPAWQLTLPASIRIESDVVITRRAIARGTTLSAADLQLESRPFNARATFTTQADVIGHVARRDLTAGQTLHPELLETQRLVRAGEGVTLTGGGAGVVVTTRGLALADGALGDRVRVRNERSGVVIDAFVTDRGVVSARPPPTPPSPSPSHRERPVEELQTVD